MQNNIDFSIGDNPPSDNPHERIGGIGRKAYTIIHNTSQSLAVCYVGSLISFRCPPSAPVNPLKVKDLPLINEIVV